MIRLILLVVILFTHITFSKSQINDDYQTDVELHDNIPSNPYTVSLEKVQDSIYYFNYIQKGQGKEFSFCIKSKVNTVYTASFNLDLKRGTIQLDGPYYFKTNDSLTEKGVFKNNVPVGDWHYYTPKSVLYKTITYNIDQKGTELHQFINPDGKVQRAAEIKNNMLNGEEKIYFPNDSVQAISHYTNGVLNRNVMLYSPNGEFIQQKADKSEELTQQASTESQATFFDDLTRFNINMDSLMSSLYIDTAFNSYYNVGEDIGLEILINEENKIQKVWLDKNTPKTKPLQQYLKDSLTNRELPFTKSLAGFPIPVVLDLNLKQFINYLTYTYYGNPRNNLRQHTLNTNFSWTYIGDTGWLRLLDLTKEKAKQDFTETESFIVVDKMPQFPGGQVASMKFITDNIEYPPLAMHNNIEGRVNVAFIVKKDGTLDDVKVGRGVHPLLDKEAIRIIKAMPRWEPGSLKRKPADVKFMLPVNFELEKPEPYMIVDKMPQFPGGDAKFMQFLRETVTYPHEAQERGIQGCPIVGFVVSKDGIIRDVEIRTSIHPLIDQEAIRVVRAMPRWIPGSLEGVPVDVKYMIPVNFVLQ